MVMLVVLVLLLGDEVGGSVASIDKKKRKEKQCESMYTANT